MISEKQGFRFHNIKDIGDFLIIDSSLGEESIINYINKNKIENLSFNEYDGFLSNDVKPYSKLHSVKRIEFILSNIDSDQISNFKNVTYLYLSSPLKKKMDFFDFKNLQYLNIEWSNKIINLNSLGSLKSLTLRNYKGNPVELTELVLLKEIGFIQGNIDSIEFTQKLKGLEKLSLSYLKSLENIKPINQINLKYLEIDSCKNINFEGAFVYSQNLESLKISNSSSILNLRFLTNLKNLKFFSFVGTNIEDGDITPCLNLDYVGFDNRKHYNCINIDGKAVLKN